MFEASMSMILLVVQIIRSCLGAVFLQLLCSGVFPDIGPSRQALLFYEANTSFLIFVCQVSLIDKINLKVCFID